MQAILRWIAPKRALPKERQLFSNAALKAMILPLVIEQVLQMVVGLADTMMVSHAGEAVVADAGAGLSCADETDENSLPGPARGCGADVPAHVLQCVCPQPG